MDNFIKDFKASVVVFLVALPLCLGIALASGAPLFAGLIAGIIGGLVVGSLSSSQLSVSGPAAGLTVIVASAIQDLGAYEAFALAVVFSGLIQIIFYLLKLGKLGGFFPNSVIQGMLAAIGIILILKQIPHAVGYDADYVGDLSFRQQDGYNTFSEIIHALGALEAGAVIISVISIALILLWNSLSKSKSQNILFSVIPSALLAVLAGIFLNQFFKSNFPSLYLSGDHVVSLNFSGGLKEFFKTLRYPDWSQLSNAKIYTVALTIAIVGSLESLLSLDAADKLDPHKRQSSKDRELLAQGVGNTVSGLLGGLPLTAVIVRTTANISNGAESRKSAVLHALWLFVFVIFLPFIIELIPLSALAAILVVIGFKLSSISLFKKFYNKGWNQFIPFVVTILAILLTDLLVGIFIGMLVGVFFVIRSDLHNSVVVAKEGKDTLLRFTHDASFFHKPRVMSILNSIEPNSHVILDGAKNVYIDDDILVELEEFVSTAEEKNIEVDIVKSKLALTDFFRES